MSVKIVDKDLGWKSFFKRAHQIKNSKVKVGVLADSSLGGMHAAGGDLTVAEIAAVVHFGTENGHIPPRPFLTSTFDKEREALTKKGKELMSEVLEGKMTTEKALNIMGASLADSAKKTITAGMGPPNAPSTVARKGSSKPLIDTGRLLGAITWAIDHGNEPE